MVKWAEGMGITVKSNEEIMLWREGAGIGEMGITVKSNEEIMYTLFHLGLKMFAAAVMCVFKTVFAMPD